MDYQVKLESFTGPLDLLLHLIEKEEVDLYQIPLAKITEEYIDYLKTLETLDLDMLSEFILIAVTLLQIKAALLFPDPIAPEKERTDQPDLKEQLLEKLVEYRKFKKAAELLVQWGEIEKKMYGRSIVGAEEKEQILLGELDLKTLTKRLQKILGKKEVKKEITKVIILEQYTTEERMEQIWQLVLQTEEPVEFNTIFLADQDKLSVLTSFLALLELVKMQKVQIRQEMNFMPIWIVKEGCTWKKKN